MPIFVPPSGPTDASIALIGEAPGEQEELQGAPFVGASGNLLKSWWLDVGIDPWSVYRDNVVPFRPPGGSIHAVDQREIWTTWVPELRRRLESLTNVRVLVPTGNVAMRAVLGVATSGILDVRGSVYDAQLRDRTLVCVPTIHPAWFLRGGPASMRKQGRALADWAKVKRIAEEGRKTVVREILTDPSDRELEYFRANITGVLSLDIETLGGSISCVGFAASPYLAIVFPTLSSRQKERYWPAVKALCESRYEKVLHNGHYDAYWLRMFGVCVNSWKWDTMWMHHALEPTDNHGLQYLASLYAEDYRAWKEEKSDDDKEAAKKISGDPRLLWEYNGRDAFYTREVFEHLESRLQAAGRERFYHDHYSRLFDPLLDTMLHGVRVDGPAQRRVAEELREDNLRIRRELKALAGKELYAVDDVTEWREPTEEEKEKLWCESEATGKRVFDRVKARELGYAAATRGGLVGVKREVLKKDFSNDRLKKWFYDEMGLARQTRVGKSVTGKRRVTTVDETALKKLAARYPEKAGRAVALILKHRENKGEIDDLNGKWDKDGRIRCQYSFNTEAGRFASKSNPMRSGRNLQNVKKGSQRRTYLPDRGCVFLAVDGSQVEDRVVKMLTGSKRLVELANTKPHEFDAHTYNASRIFGVREREVTRDQRNIGKMAVHAAQRGMKGARLADVLLTEFGLAWGATRCQKLIDAYLADHHEIRDVYFPSVRKEMFEKRCLVNTWGRVWTCTYDRLDDDAYRRGYSFGPQSECNDLMVQWGYLPIVEHITKWGLSSRVNLLVHDEIILSCSPEEIYQVARVLVNSLERPRSYPAGKLVVPMVVSVGANWGEKHEFKGFPGEEEMREVVKGLKKGV